MALLRSWFKGFFMLLVGTLLTCTIAFSQTGTPDTEAPSSAPLTKCTLKLEQSPELRGFRLGMDVKQVVARFPELQVESADEFGSRQVEIYPSSDRSQLKKSGFENVERVALTFFEERLTSVSVRYDTSIKWKSPDEFVSRIAGPLGLSGTWRPVDRWRRTLECDGFRVTAGAGLLTLVTLEETAAGVTLEERRKVLMERRRKLESALKEKEEKQRREEAERKKAFKP
jgi:hypothetical protein